MNQLILAAQAYLAATDGNTPHTEAQTAARRELRKAISEATSTHGRSIDERRAALTDLILDNPIPSDALGDSQ